MGIVVLIVSVGRLRALAAIAAALSLTEMIAAIVLESLTVLASNVFVASID